MSRRPLDRVESLLACARRILTTAEAESKARLALETAEAWTAGGPDYRSDTGPVSPPARPAHPDIPELLLPNKMPRRRIGSPTGHLALIHAVAHIEFNAIDLAWDLICRFGGYANDDLQLGLEFFDDWIRVGQEEATHFTLVNQRLKELGSYYGAMPAHDGLWDAADSTKDNLLARLAIVPMVLEARGLDVNPAMAQRLRRIDDHRTADILDIIYTEEIGHVETGTKWYHIICRKLGLNPEDTFRRNLNLHFKGQLKPPFNTVAREKAGLPRSYYEIHDPDVLKSVDLN